MKNETLLSLVAFGLFLMLAAGSGGGSDDDRTPEQKAKAAAEDRQKGFHCLSSWDGSHRVVVKYVEERLRDPDSFEHIETRITPVNENGEHMLIMKYRAKNGFGGMSVGAAMATIENSDCSAVITTFE